MTPSTVDKPKMPGVVVGMDQRSPGLAILQLQEPLVATALDIVAPCEAAAPSSEAVVHKEEKSCRVGPVGSGVVLEVRTGHDGNAEMVQAPFLAPGPVMAARNLRRGA